MDEKEKLSIQWLNQRQPYDDAARNSAMRTLALGQWRNEDTPIISDLGAGTGNNTLFLINHLPCSARLILVERHPYLLEHCRERMQQLFESEEVEPGLTRIRHRGFTYELEYQNVEIDEWLRHSPAVSLHTASALFDLFTWEEIERLFQQLSISKTPLYSVLNYCGVDFSPSAPEDVSCIQLFEQHMSRALDKGSPVGALVMRAVAILVKNQDALTLQTGPSNWHVSAKDIDFLQMNLDFYQRGINAVTQTNGAHVNFEHWVADKQWRVDQCQLTLTVRHQDFVIKPSS